MSRWKVWIPVAAVCIAAVAGLIAGMAKLRTDLFPAWKESVRNRISARKGRKRIPLRLMWLPDPKATEPRAKADLAVFQAFRKKYPHIEVSSFSGITIPGIEDESKIMLAVAGGTAPDVFSYINFRMSGTYIQQGFLYPLDEFIQRDRPGGIKAFMAGVPDPVRPVAQRAGPAVGGNPAGIHVWALPGDVQVRVLMWRKDLFQEVGLDPDRPPRDWQELYRYAEKLSDPARGRYGMNMTGGAKASWDFMAFLWSAGGEAVVKDKTGAWVAAYGSREAAEALDFYVRLLTGEWVDPDGKKQRGCTVVGTGAENRSYRLWCEGRIGMNMMYLGGDQMAGGTDMSLIGIGPFPPRVKGEKSGTELNTNLHGVFAGIEGRRNTAGQWCSAKEIREAAWNYINFLDSDEARGIRAGVLVAHGMGRTLSPEWLKKYGYEEYLKYFPEGLQQLFDEAVKNGKPEPYGRNCQMVYSFMSEPLNEAMRMARENELPADKESRLRVLQQLLGQSAEKTTEQMIGRLTPEERARRNSWAVTAGIVILALICFALYRIWLIFSPKDSYSGRRRGWEFRKNATGYLIMLPALLSILIWVYCPMVSGSMLLFQDYRVAGGSVWTGFNNLADVLFNADWWRSVVNTLRYMLLSLGLGFVIPIILAILLQEVSHCKRIYRTLYYLPAVMSGLVVIYMWKLFFQSGSTGIMNQALQAVTDGINAVIVPAGTFFDPKFTGLSFEPVAWLEDPHWAMLACVIPVIWAGAGPGCLIYLAALKGVPEETYETAEIDGANFFQKIWHVTLPALKPLILINFVGAFIAAAQSGGMILIMTFGNADTNVAELYIFKEAYTNLRFGTAIAMAWILGITMLLFTIYQMKKLSTMEFKTTGK